MVRNGGAWLHHRPGFGKTIKETGAICGIQLPAWFATGSEARWKHRFLRPAAKAEMASTMKQ